MIQPALAGEAFLADVRRAAEEPDNLYLWWLGQSGYLVAWRKQYLLIDPYLSDSLTKKYAGTDKPHVRMTERVIAPEQLDFVDVVTSSHNHTDHLDGETLGLLLQANPALTVVVSEANRAFAATRLEVAPERLTGISLDVPLVVGGFTLHAVPAAHEALERDENGHCRYIGLVVEAGPWTLYHSGDTVLYEGFERWLGRWAVDVTILPINGRDPKRGVPGNLSGEEATRLARDMVARQVIPCHYDMFEFNTVSPRAFIETAEELGQAYRVLECGERWTSACLGELPPV